MLLLVASSLFLMSCERSGGPEGEFDGPRSAADLSRDDKREIEDYINRLVGHAGQSRREVSSYAVSRSDLWLGMRYIGLHRMDRKSKAWESYLHGEIGERIDKVWLEGKRVWVEHGFWGAHSYCFVSYTTDRGRRWTRFLMGDGTRQYVHAPRFTNQGLRTERMRRITNELKKGTDPDDVEDIFGYVKVDQEVYFTIYVNSAEGWLAVYRYDVPADKLKDLGIAELDPGAVGAREFHLDPHDPRLLWILSGGYGGAIQYPRRWFLYDRKTEAMKDTGLDYGGQSRFLDLIDIEWRHMDMISFEPDRVLFLGPHEGQIKPVAQYDRATGQVKHL